MKKRLTSLLLRLRRPYLTILLSFSVLFMYAQTSSVSFNVNGSIEVTNDVLHLQTTALLNLPELYRLPAGVPSQVIRMTVSPQYGSDPRVEIRVYDYNDATKTKGSLIYAASGTKNGWNEEELRTLVLFSDQAQYSQALSDRFNSTRFKSTDIKKLSQFENLGSVCNSSFSLNDYSTYVDGVFGNKFIPMIALDASGNATTTRGDDEDGGEEEEEEPEDYGCNFGEQKEEKEEKASASKTEAENKNNESNKAHASEQKAEDELSQAAKADQAAKDDAIAARENANKAFKNFDDARNEAVEADEQLLLDIQKCYLLLPQSEIKEINSARDKALNSVALADGAEADRELARMDVETKLKALFDARGLVIKALRSCQGYRTAMVNRLASAKEDLSEAYNNLISAEGDVQRQNNEIAQIWTKVQAAAAHGEGRTIEYLSEYQKANRFLDFLKEIVTDRNDTYRQALVEYEEAVGEIEYFRSHGFPQQYNDALSFAQVSLSTASAELNVASQRLTLATAVWNQKAGNAVDDLYAAADVFADFDYDIPEVYNQITKIISGRIKVESAEKRANMLLRLANGSNLAAYEAERLVLLAQAYTTDREETLTTTKVAFMKASAEATWASWQADDDDDAAAGAVAAFAVADAVSGSEDDPGILINALGAFGSPYLFGDEKDTQLFHNTAITPTGLLNFQLEFFECATGSSACWNQPVDIDISDCAASSGQVWCDQLSPMPVVLIEVAIKNAKLDTVKIPGIPHIPADRFQSTSPLYDADPSARYISLKQSGEYIGSSSHQIIEAPYATEVQVTGFPKLDHIKVPDVTSTKPQEFKMSDWGRLPIAGTYERLEALEQELTAKANAAGVAPEEYFLFRHISHDFIKVSKAGINGTLVPDLSDEITYELRTLMINRQYADQAFTTMVTAEGPFEASNGLLPAGTQLPP
ncbi:MAG: hypothetical protein ACOYXT_23130, partial [Bacteroidota bacterium]